MINYQKARIFNKKIKQNLILLFALIIFTQFIKAVGVDSLKQKLSRLPVQEQFELINDLSFDDVVGNCQKIIPILLQYETLVKEHKKPVYLARIYLNLSLANYYLGSYDENLKYGLKSLALYDSLDNKMMVGTMYGELGYQMKQRNLLKAAEYMLRGISILERLNLPGPLAKIYDNYGVLKEMGNQLDSANFYYRKALSIKKELKDSVGIPYSLNNVCMIFMLKQNYDSALFYLNKSTAIRQFNNDNVGLSENYGYYGQIYSSIGNYDKAIESLNKSLDLAKKLNFTSLEKSVYSDLAEIYERMNDYRSALFYQKLHKQLADSLINVETNKAIANLQVQFETSEKEKALLQKTSQLRQQRIIKTSILISSLILLLSVVVFFWNKILLIRRNEKIKVQNALIEGEQTERNRLALELHDSVANDLNGVILLLRNTENIGEAYRGNSINRSIEKLNETHQQVRKLSHTLMPRSLKEKGLMNAINDLANDFRSINFNIDIQILGLEERLTPFIEFNIFCIIQESLNNIVKHSQATNVFIECNRIDQTLFVTIEDNGVGFDTNSIGKTSGIGMQNLMNRVKMMEGTINMNSTLGQGTNIEIQIPLN